MTREMTRLSVAADGGESIAAHLELLADMGRDFAASLDIEATLARALGHITRHLDGEGGALFLLDEAGETLRCEASIGASEITGLTLNSGTGIVGRCVQGNRAEMVRDVATDSGFYGGVDAATGVTTRSILCAPMSVKNERIGAIEIINKRGGDGLFDDADLNVLKSLSTSAALAVLNARMAAALVEQERIKRELELAAEIQRSLLPAAQPGTFPIHGVNHPARTVSGDFYDFFTLADGRVCFNLGDVSGKGMDAALLMAKTASLFRCLGKTMHDPGRLLGLINAEICETVTRGMFVTMVGGIFNPATGIMRLANAGHEPPLHHTRDGAFTALAAEAPPLGISTGLVADDIYPETELGLNGGTLYIFTDGVTEGYLEDGTTFEVDGLKASLAENGALSLSDRLAAVVGRVKRGDDALRDDLTILGVEDVR
jgi:sigma-B regulation protein RsbU (phosphoserine phosphatase)